MRCSPLDRPSRRLAATRAVPRGFADQPRVHPTVWWLARRPFGVRLLSAAASAGEAGDMAISRKALARVIRNPVAWLIVAVAVGTFLGWAAASASADGDTADTAGPGRVVTRAIAGADVLLPSSAIAPSRPLAPADDG